MGREDYGTGEVTLMIERNPRGEDRYFVQVGIAGMYFDLQEIVDTHALFSALLDELKEEDTE